MGVPILSYHDKPITSLGYLIYPNQSANSLNTYKSSALSLKPIMP